ncbi:MAG: hypothetical protein NWF05_05205 [Candidatus Bathyarchaeota archaeon]|nr:hypothetical protein [Candidatus Bathyarchaeota archaeon]
MKNKMLILAVFILVSGAFLCLPFVSAQTQPTGTAITAVDPLSGPAGKDFNVTVSGTLSTPDGSFVVYFSNSQANYSQFEGNATGYSVTANFEVPALQAGNYSIILKDVATGAEAVYGGSLYSYHLAAEGIAVIPMATLLIMGIALAISFGNMVLNRLLITRMIGWHEYRSMQKEISEFNSQRMAAMRAKNDKALEKLKKKESQIQAMQTKMFKPQLLLLPMTAIYFVIWPILYGFFTQPAAYLPGLGVLPFLYWYMICSFFFGTIASRIIGVTPIQ